MSILNFVTQEELDNLSEDPRIAFMELVNHAQRRLSNQIADFDPDNEYQSTVRFGLEKSFMNVIVAAGKKFEVEPFSTMEIPRHQNFRNSDYEQFRSDLDHYITQLILDNSSRSRGSSVKILPQSKDKIRSYVHGLRDCLEKANMQDALRKTLLSKLDEFERELEKPRTSFLSLAVIAIAIVGAPGGTWASVDVAHKLVTNITQVFAEAKQEEDQTRRIGSQAVPKSLSPPRTEKEKPLSWQPSQGSNLDDDIPF